MPFRLLRAGDQEDERLCARTLDAPTVQSHEFYNVAAAGELRQRRGAAERLVPARLTGRRADRNSSVLVDVERVRVAAGFGKTRRRLKPTNPFGPRYGYRLVAPGWPIGRGWRG